MSRLAVMQIAVLALVSVILTVAVAAWLTAPPPATVSARLPTTADIERRVRDLERRLAKQPDDAEGWKMLGRSYLALERYRDAVGAWSQAAQLMPRDSEVRAALQRLSEIARERGRHDAKLPPP